MDILASIRSYLDQSLHQNMEMPEELIEEFGELCKSAVRRRFAEPPKTEFTLRMSNIGRPLCQLKMEKDGAPKETPGYNHPVKMLVGDICEYLVYIVTKASGYPITGYQTPCTMRAVIQQSDGTEKEVLINGTLDMEDENGVWDTKSSATWTFEHKFSDDHMGGYEQLKANDSFGYLAQGYGYGVARQKYFKGWIVVCKETGEIIKTETPWRDHDKYIEELKSVMIKTAVTRDPDLSGEFVREFVAVDEVFKKVPTGNKKLEPPCSFCDYKWSCWPGLKLLPQIPSTAKNPKLIYYTEIKEQSIEASHDNKEPEGEGEGLTELSQG